MLVNEYGKVALDHHLLRQIQESTIVLSGGCVCCTVRDDLVREMKNLLNDTTTPKNLKPERIIIETSGLADPVPIVFTILTDPVLQHHFYVSQILTTLDAINGELHLRRQCESVKQILVADIVLLTKTDIATEMQIQNLLTQVYQLNPGAVVIPIGQKTNDLGMLLNESFVNREIFDVRENVSNSLMKLSLYKKENLIIDNESKLTKISSERCHEDHIESVSLTFDHPLDWTAFGIWLSMMLHAHGEDVLRVKGIIDVGEAGPVVLQGVQHIIHPPEHLASWPTGESGSKLVFITRNIVPKEILSSLKSFQGMLGATASPLQMNAWM